MTRLHHRRPGKRIRRSNGCRAALRIDAELIALIEDSPAALDERRRVRKDLLNFMLSVLYLYRQPGKPFVPPVGLGSTTARRSDIRHY